MAKFSIRIERNIFDEKGIIGYMYINDLPVCYTLELPWLDNKKQISAVPIGFYNTLIRYDKKDQWRIQLKNVIDRNGVQVHVGNYTTEIKGCILVGLEVDASNFSISKSKKAYSILKQLFYGSENPVNSPNIQVTVEIMELM